MLVKKVSQRIWLIGIIIALLGLWGGWYLIINSPAETMELPNAYIDSNLVSLYLQPVILALMYTQILRFRNVRLLVGVRGQTNQMTKRLLILVTMYCLVFCLGLIVPYLFTSFPLFRNGNSILGTMILVLHVGILLFLAWVLVGAYNLKHPYLLLLIIFILEMAYHFYFEKQILIKYSPLYDPLYRAVHHIYGGY
ncbi:hypothetical protein OZY43_05870 [Lactobacillus sp. ESL0785]|uniref:hypothetical protein n=1 Tax=Lactobacillus sp. ESL0785 TaxID=2983232 RepID=UPI0023F8C348|nr:hypothetical protein [Lactobacillus sp. ESL0785]WEV70469.1 hypothetical protein OZY43_05870 [Lactobacillus sp. ESL0785]